MTVAQRRGGKAVEGHGSSPPAEQGLRTSVWVSQLCPNLGQTAVGFCKGNAEKLPLSQSRPFENPCYNRVVRILWGPTLRFSSVSQSLADGIGDFRGVFPCHGGHDEYGLAARGPGPRFTNQLLLSCIGTVARRSVLAFILNYHKSAIFHQRNKIRIEFIG